MNNDSSDPLNFTHDPYSTILHLLDKGNEEHKNSKHNDDDEPSTNKQEAKESLYEQSDTLDSTIEENEENQNASDPENASSEDVFQQNNIEAPDTLDSLLNFLKTSGSPVSGLLDLRSLLLEQKEEKVMLRTLVDQMKVDIAGLR